MALVACKECGAQVSTSAKACPQCGAKRARQASKLAWVFAGVLLFAIISGIASRTFDQPPPAPAAPQKDPKIAAKQDAEVNAAIAAVQAIKAAQKNPDSFKLKSFVIFDGGATCVDYSATNSFNAVIPGRAVFVPPGKVLVQESNGNQFIKAWNDVCTKSGGREQARGLNQLGVF